MNPLSGDQDSVRSRSASEHVPKRKVAIVTGSRAEYGLLYWLLKEVQDDPDLELQLVVTGMHLSPEFGLTYREIERDGFAITSKVESLLSSDTPVGISKSIGLGVISLAESFERLKPDVIVLLGDRFEIFAAAQAAMVARIPLAHIHGGETTLGAIDEAIRHCITKMSHFHFTAAEPYRQRVIQLGEDPKRVFNFGAIGLDNGTRLDLLDRASLEEFIGFPLERPYFLVTFHPVTLEEKSSRAGFTSLLEALDHFPEANVVFTKPNADTDGRIIGQLIDGYVEAHNNRAVAFTSMGQLKYLSAMKYADVVVGNSSSGIIEAPMFKRPSVDIGRRQMGRLRAASIIQCEETAESIRAAIEKARSREMRDGLKHVQSLYGSGNVSAKIKDCIKTASLKDIVIKRFGDR